MSHRATQRASFYRRHGAMAAGLLALWLQFLAFAAPMPGMAMDQAGGGGAISAVCAMGLDGGKPAPSNKSSLPCLQCPLCQTLHVLALGAAPSNAVVPAPAFLPSPLAWPVADAAGAPLAAPAGFSSRAPPAV